MRAVRLALIAAPLLIATEVKSSPFWSIETLYQDIEHAKENEEKIFEVKIRSADSVWQSTYVDSTPTFGFYCGKNCPSVIKFTHPVFAVTARVLSNITVQNQNEGAEFIAVDNRPHSNLFWKKVWKPDKMSNATWILITDKKNRVKALYTTQSIRIEEKNIKEAYRRETSNQVRRILADTRYKGFINQANLIRILKREDLYE